jgi:hypothetical protein
MQRKWVDIYQWRYANGRHIWKVLDITNHQGNANDTKMQCYFTLAGMAFIKNKCWWGYGEKGIQVLLVEFYHHYVKHSMSLEKLK